eukprot:9494376-Pyramimonas_sp.AAC.1
MVSQRFQDDPLGQFCIVRAVPLANRRQVGRGQCMVICGVGTSARACWGATMALGRAWAVRAKFVAVPRLLWRTTGGLLAFEVLPSSPACSSAPRAVQPNARARVSYVALRFGARPQRH